MKVTLNIENDEELRLYIKDCIRGQVTSVIREEILEIAKTEIERKLKDGKMNIEYLIRVAITDAVTNILRKDYGVGEWGDKFITPSIEKKLSEVLAKKDWNGLINVLAKEKISKLLK